MSKQPKKQPCELIMWESIKRDCKLPDDDNNEGLIYGINLLDDTATYIIDVEWYESEEKRAQAVIDYDLRIVNE